MDLAKSMEELFDRLWPLHRSILGEGIRASFDLLAEKMPTERLRFPSGQKVFDWTVPPEWSVREAYVIDPQGRKRFNFHDNNLHLLGYSCPFRGEMGLSELQKHLYSLPEQPDAIPYLTSYYKERWGFCLSHQERETLPEGRYQVVVDTRLGPGHLEVAEAVLPGTSSAEIHFSSYACHPSLASNELSGPLVLVFLYDRLRKRPKRKWTYRFLLSAETIGTIAYLSLRGDHLKRQMIAGYQVTCVGDSAPFTYKCSRRENSLADWTAREILKGRAHRWVRFDAADGSDERQYASPAFDLPVGSLMRTMYAQYPEYHTSLDNKSFVSFPAMAETVDVYEALVDRLESAQVFRNRDGRCEPHLSQHGLYPSLGSQKEIQEGVRAIMWCLNASDGMTSLSQIAERSGLRLRSLEEAAGRLLEAGLLEER